MKSLLVFITAVVNLLLLLLLKKRIFSVAGIFNIMWGICLGLSCLGLWEIDTPSWTVVIIACFSMLIFTASTMIHIKRIKPIMPRGISFIQCNISDEKQKHKGMVLFHIIAYTFSIPYFRSIFRLLKSGNLYLIRVNAFESNSNFTSTASLTIFQNIIAPLFVATMIMALIDAANQTLKISTLVFAVTDIVLYTVLFAGRYMFFQTLVLTIFIFYDFSRLKSVFLFIHRHKKIILFVSIIVIVLVYISINRSSLKFIQSLYIYFCGSFSYLTKLIDSRVGTELYLLGKTQFGFIYNFVYMIATVVFGVPYRGSNYIVTQLTKYMTPIGGGIYYNALGTFLHDFMTDYGVWGSLIGVLIFSIFCQYVERAKNYYNDYFHRSVYYYVLFVVVNTVLGYSLRSPAFVFLLTFCWLFSVKREGRRCQDLV